MKLIPSEHFGRLGEAMKDEDENDILPLNVHKKRWMQKDLLERIPVGQIGKPEDIAYTALFLASNEASYITGQTITVDGGRVIN